MVDSVTVGPVAQPDPATTEAPWVGRSVLRVEDDALLRGEGRFLDDLAPVAHSFHAAVVRSQLAHARIAVDATAALAAPGCRRRPHRRRCRGAVAPVSGRDRDRNAAVRRRDRHGALRRRADRRRRRQGSLPGRGRGRARRGRLRPARRRSRPRRRGRPCGARPNVRLRRRRRGDGRRPTWSSARPSTSPASPARPSSATRSSPTGTRPPGG